MTTQKMVKRIVLIIIGLIIYVAGIVWLFVIDYKIGFAIILYNTGYKFLGMIK
jgi:uncharacterized membrane protein